MDVVAFPLQQGAEPQVSAHGSSRCKGDGLLWCCCLWLLCFSQPRSKLRSRAKEDRGGVCAHDKLSKGLALQAGSGRSSPRQPGLGQEVSGAGEEPPRGSPASLLPCHGEGLDVLPLPRAEAQAPAHSSASGSGSWWNVCREDVRKRVQTAATRVREAGLRV